MQKVTLISLAVLLLFSSPAVGVESLESVFSNENPYDEWPNVQAANVEKAIDFLMAPNPRARIMREKPYRKNVVESLVRNARRHDVPVLLLTTVAFRESSFDDQALGALGEFGLMQVMPRWRKVLGCDFSSAAGQIDCAARMISRYKETCKSWQGALTAYATGKGCTTGPLTTKKIQHRIRQWKRLEVL
jgi:hypothetical protein